MRQPSKMPAKGYLSPSKGRIHTTSLGPANPSSRGMGMFRAALEVEAEFGRIRPRRHKMRSAERGQEIVERHLIGQVDGREPQAPLVTIAMEEAAVSTAGIEQVARVDAWRIVVVILRSTCRYLEPGRPVQSRVARNQRSTQRWGSAAAEEPGLYLLVRGEPCEIHRRRGVRRKGNSAGHKTAVVAPIESHPRSAFPRLVLRVRGLLKHLVVIDAKHGSIAGA